MDGGEGLPGIAAEAGLPVGEVADGEVGAVGLFEFGPGEGHGDLHAGACSGGEGGYGGGAAFVAEIVDEDAVFAGGFGHHCEVEAWFLLLHHEGEVVGESFDGRPVVFWFDGDDDVEAFAAGALEEGFEVQLF